MQLPDNTLMCVLGDTHVPDRVRELPTGLLEHISQHKPDMIIHTGDVCTRSILKKLSAIAPVYAVQGNRDWFLGLHLPKNQSFLVHGVSISVAHGHCSLLRYLRDLFRFIVLKHEVIHTYYQKLLSEAFSASDLIIYGHTHYQVDEIMDGKRFINPGASYPCKLNSFMPEYAIIQISSDGSVTCTFHGISSRVDM